MKGDEEGEGEKGAREKGKRNIPVRHLLCRNFSISPFSFNRLKNLKNSVISAGDLHGSHPG